MDMSMPNSHLDHDHSAAGSSVVDVGRYDGLTFDATADLFKALSSPLRLAIVHAVHESPKCVHELVTELGVSQPLVSQHLRVLRAFMNHHVISKNFSRTTCCFSDPIPRSCATTR